MNNLIFNIKFIGYIIQLDKSFKLAILKKIEGQWRNILKLKN